MSSSFGDSLRRWLNHGTAAGYTTANEAQWLLDRYEARKRNELVTQDLAASIEQVRGWGNFGQDWTEQDDTEEGRREMGAEHEAFAKWYTEGMTLLQRLGYAHVVGLTFTDRSRPSGLRQLSYNNAGEQYLSR